MSTQAAIGGLIGGVIGFFVAGPAGAAAGFAAGAGLGAALTPMQMPGQQGPRLSDLKVQTSTYGAAIPRVYGTVGITGNVIWLEGNQLKEVVSRRKVKAGGKGGSKKTTVTTYTYYGTLAIGLCEGPIAGVRRIWAGPNLIYDAASDDLETIIASNQNAAGFSVYLGGADQQPDSRIQADRGVANTPAYRGLAYVVIKDFLLTDYGNAIPAFKVEVMATAENAAPQMLMRTVTQRQGEFIAPIVSSVGGSPYVATFNEPLWSAAYPESGTLNPIKMSSSGGAFISAQLVSARSSGFQNISPYDYGRIYEEGGQLRQEGEFFLTPTAPISSRVYQARDRSIYYIGSGVVVKTAPDSDGEGPIEYHDVSIVNSSVLAVTHDGSVLVCSGAVAITLTGSLELISRIDDAYPLSNTYCLASDELGAIFAANATTGTPLLRLSSDLRSVEESIAIQAAEALSKTICMHIRDGALFRAYPSAGGAVGEAILIAAPSASSPDLADIVSAEAVGSGLITFDDVDVSRVAGVVSGYRVSGGSIRSALTPLRSAFPFDAYQSGYRVAFASRGEASAAVIDISELGVDEQLPQSREIDGQLPARLSVSYLDATRNYDANEQFAERINTEAVNDSDLELAVVMTASQAAQVAERLLGVAWLERASFGPFQLPPTYRHLEPTDVIVIDASYAQYELRLTEVSYNADGTLTCAGTNNSAAVYVSDAASDETPSQQVIGLRGESLFVPLDIPVIDETIQDSPGFVGAMTGYAAGWPGSVAAQSPDGGQTWVEIQAFDGRATVGYASGVLAANSCALIDETALAVSLLSGELESVTAAQMLGGTNWAAYGADGRWEIVRFRDAVLQADGSYLLSGFKRGDKGTEWATGIHQPGDLFIPLDDGDLAVIGMPVEAVGVASTWRGVTAGDAVDSASDVPFTYLGTNLRPLSPAYPVASRSGGGDLALAWTRRSRLSSSWWATGTAAPLGEASESYEVDILNGSTVVRTIASSTPSITYTAAQQTADFGSAQASIATRIYQLSAVVGRGYALEVTV